MYAIYIYLHLHNKLWYGRMLNNWWSRDFRINSIWMSDWKVYGQRLGSVNVCRRFFWRLFNLMGQEGSPLKWVDPKGGPGNGTRRSEWPSMASKTRRKSFTWGSPFQCLVSMAHIFLIQWKPLAFSSSPGAVGWPPHSVPFGVEGSLRTPSWGSKLWLGNLRFFPPASADHDSRGW